MFYSTGLNNISKNNHNSSNKNSSKTENIHSDGKRPKKARKDHPADNQAMNMGDDEPHETNNKSPNLDRNSSFVAEEEVQVPMALEKTEVVTNVRSKPVTRAGSLAPVRELEFTPYYQCPKCKYWSYKPCMLANHKKKMGH